MAPVWVVLLPERTCTGLVLLPEGLPLERRGGQEQSALAFLSEHLLRVGVEASAEFEQQLILHVGVSGRQRQVLDPDFPTQHLQANVLLSLLRGADEKKMDPGG